MNTYEEWYDWNHEGYEFPTQAWWEAPDSNKLDYLLYCIEYIVENRYLN